jgi:putative transposase
MYDYRKMTPEERQQVVRERRERGFPWHAPPHVREVRGEYLITAACFEHKPVFADPVDLSFLFDETLEAFAKADLLCHAWVFLPNHYHVLLATEDLAIVGEVLRLLHSRVATEINGRYDRRGRQVWYRYSDRMMRGPRHRLVTVNYLHYNPVKHGYVDRMTEWPWSSVHRYVEEQGKDMVLQAWREYPMGDYGRGWDW